MGEKSLLFSFFLNIFITVAEIAGGILSGSLSLLSDAFHNLSDSASLLISYIALLIGKKSKSPSKTYGYKRAEILAALANVIILLLVCFYIIFEAVKRISHPEKINTGLMLIVAFLGLFGNGISVLMLFKDSKKNINIKSSFLHLLGDTISSFAVILTAVVLFFKPWYLLDTIMSIAISLYIIKESISILMESVNILMQGAPRGLNKDEIIKKLMSEKELKIRGIHHIHMWDITPGKTVFDVHIVVDQEHLKDANLIIGRINHILQEDFHISHSTIQLESGSLSHCISCDL
jgi:cobalt-zinc-cadmium efflux system protein